MGQEYNQSGARKLILIYFQSIVYQCFKPFIILTMESLSLRIKNQMPLSGAFFVGIACKACFAKEEQRKMIRAKPGI
jgi:hypothetical protein